MAERFAEWDSACYHRLSTPHVSWGRKILAWLSLRGDETVLDAGYGTGLLTADLLELLPRGTVVCVDLSDNMLTAARIHLQARAVNRVVFVKARAEDLPFVGAFDGVFSAATFHWILNHDRLFRSIFHALRPGGRLCAQCGGGPNIKKLLARVDALAVAPPFSQFLAGYKIPCEFSDARTAADRLRRAGFASIETSLEPTPTRFDTCAEFRQFISTVILRTHLEQIPSQQMREGFLDALIRKAADDNPPYELDYWRLNLRARRPGSPARITRHFAVSQG